jgi:hypothetical protein
MKRILILAALALAACNQETTPMTPSPGEPCGAIGVQCSGGGCCDRRSEVCGQKGHACGEDECCFIGDDGHLFGTKRRATHGVTDAGTK